jgi:hypothetical protein
MLTPLEVLSRGRECGVHEIAVAENPLITVEPIAQPTPRREGLPTPGAPDQPSPGQLRSTALRDAIRDKIPVRPPGRGAAHTESPQYLSHGLPRPCDVAQQGAMAAPWVTVQRPEVLRQPGPHRIEVEIAHQLEQVRFLLAQDRFVAILEEIPVAVMATVEDPCVSRQDASHDRRQRDATRTEQKVHVVG